MDLETQTADVTTKKTQVRWNDRMDNILIDALFGEALLGGRTDNGWKSETLTRVTKLVQKATTDKIKNEHLRSRLKTLKSHWSDVNDAATASGFSFNHMTNLIVAEDEAWAAYILVHPSATNLRDKQVKHYAELTLMFGKDSATGQSNITASDPGASAVPGRNGAHIENLDDDDSIHLSPIGDPFTQVGNTETDSSPEVVVSNPGNGKKPSKKRSRVVNDDGIVHSAFKEIAQASREMAVNFKPFDYTILDDCLDNIPNMSTDDYDDAVEIFAANPELAKLFLGMKQEKRGDWIKSKIARVKRARA